MNDGSGPTARILAMDQGAGIPNVAQAMADGYPRRERWAADLGR